MLTPLWHLAPLLRYPGDPSRGVALKWDADILIGAHSGGEVLFPVVAGQPVLIDFSRSLIKPDWPTQARLDVSLQGKRPRMLRLFKASVTGTRQISAKNIQRFLTLLKMKSPEPTLLMVGAGEMGMGCASLYADKDVKQIAFDIYPSSMTQFVADAHQIPLADESLDGVLIQAVLEHVLDPATVAAEIHRVLKPNGLVYAETPFMQPVHEGAYDFTRFTELGHRWVWREFEEIERAVVGGPGMSLHWSARYFLRAILGRNRLADMLSVPFLVFPLFDPFLSATRRVEAANGVSFLGRKTGKALLREELVAQYLGPTR